jgi:hypothetical protein
MSDHTEDYLSRDDNTTEAVKTHALLDMLLEKSRLYKHSQDYMDLLDFVVRLRNFAPFNAMLLQVQKPGLRFAASEFEWRRTFGRWIKEGARPLIILWPFGPVALVYDVVDTEGAYLPEDVQAFISTGAMSEQYIKHVFTLLYKKHIHCDLFDHGDDHAGYIRIMQPPIDNKNRGEYKLIINRNHSPAVQFTTLAHELGHLCLGHLGRDKKLNIPLRSSLSLEQQELEAESVAYIICERNGVRTKSYAYLSGYIHSNTAMADLDVYQIMRAAGQVETLLQLDDRTQY